MKTIVIYTSQTGFTERYAGWIAEAAGADCLPLSEAKGKDLSAYDAIVYGGWACAGSIRGLSWFQRNAGKWADKKLVVFCVGGSPIDNPDIEQFFKQNFRGPELGKVEAFYCPGGFNYEKMSASSKLMMKVFLKALSGKKDKTAAEEEMVKMLSSSYDISDKKYIAPILECLNR